MIGSSHQNYINIPKYSFYSIQFPSESVLLWAFRVTKESLADPLKIPRSLNLLIYQSSKMHCDWQISVTINLSTEMRKVHRNHEIPWPLQCLALEVNMPWGSPSHIWSTTSSVLLKLAIWGTKIILEKMHLYCTKTNVYSLHSGSFLAHPAMFLHAHFTMLYSSPCQS